MNAGATLREYLAAEGMRAGSLSAAALSRLGVLTTIHYASTGLGGRASARRLADEPGDRPGRLPAHLPRGRAAACRSRSGRGARSRTAPGERLGCNLHVTLFRPNGELPSLDAADHDGIPQPRGARAARCHSTSADRVRRFDAGLPRRASPARRASPPGGPAAAAAGCWACGGRRSERVLGPSRSLKPAKKLKTTSAGAGHGRLVAATGRWRRPPSKRRRSRSRRRRRSAASGRRGRTRTGGRCRTRA